MKNKKYILRPNITMFEGIRVTKKTKFTFENENVKQKLEDLILSIELKESGETENTKYEYLSTGKVTIDSGTVLLFDEKRGYYVPNYDLVTADEAIEDIKALKDFE